MRKWISGSAVFAFLALPAATLADDLVPGGWDSQVEVQPFAAPGIQTGPIVGRSGAYGYGVLRSGSSPGYGNLDQRLWSITDASGFGDYNGLVPFERTIRRSTRRRSHR